MSEEQKKKKKAPKTEKSAEEIKETDNKKEPTKEKEPENPKETRKEETVTKKEFDELNDKYLRTLAEYDNFRRRSGEEKDSIYSNAYKDAITEILPVIDSLEKAADVAGEDKDNKLAEGISMVLAQWKSACSKLGIEEIETPPGTQFDPEIHNAVMHIDDDAFGKNEITETFQKGYRHGDRVIRFAMVKVAN